MEFHNADGSARFFTPLLGHPSRSHSCRLVFLSEGIQKFLFPAALGTGRFAKLGIPWPQYSAPFVRSRGDRLRDPPHSRFVTSLASVFLLIVIAVAIASTKFPMLLKQGFWATLHEARADFSMLFGLIAIC